LRHPLLAPYLKQAGLEYVSWRIRSCDTLIKNSKVLSRRILNKVENGDIILLHDYLPKGTDVLFETLPVVIDELRSRGFEFVLAGAREDVESKSPAHIPCESAR
jgi:peptidoglycan/xylan/chitin deacetylase (PgdA/CDA1 family)